ncbi:hypothetical protein GCM10023075_59520 [Streptosporangium album]
MGRRLGGRRGPSGRTQGTERSTKRVLGRKQTAPLVWGAVASTSSRVTKRAPNNPRDGTSPARRCLPRLGGTWVPGGHARTTESVGPFYAGSWLMGTPETKTFTDQGTFVDKLVHASHKPRQGTGGHFDPHSGYSL